MKIRSILVAALAALTLASCSKEGESVTPEDGSEAYLSINITSAAPEGRGVSNGTLPADAINNYNVFVTDADGEIKWKQYSGSAAPVAAMAVKASAQHVFIVANTGDLTSTINTKAQLDAYTLNMQPTSGTLGNQFDATLGRTATGSTSQPIAFVNNSGNLEGSVTIDLTYIAARITLTVVNGMTGYDPADATGLVLKHVAVLNAVDQSKLFGSSLIPATKNYLSGIDTDGFLIWPSNVTPDVAIYKDNILPMNNFGELFYFYVYENDAVAAGQYPTIVTVIGEYNGTTKYYPVHLAPYEQLTAGSGTVSSVERGKSYNITITLNVDPTPGNPDEGGGTIDPTVPDGDANVDITVTLNDWVPVILNKDFN